MSDHVSGLIAIRPKYAVSPVVRHFQRKGSGSLRACPRRERGEVCRSTFLDRRTFWCW